MRIKDQEKQEALFQATVKLVNETGFAASSVSKIAKQAGVSPATIYIYYKNKEDLLVSTYMDIKKNMSRAFLENHDPTLPFRDIFQQFWLNVTDYISTHAAQFQYAEQFASSPYGELVDEEEIEQYFEPLILTVQRGIEQKVIKDVPFDVLKVFLFHPLTALLKEGLCRKLELTPDLLETAFDLAWDAVKR